MMKNYIYTFSLFLLLSVFFSCENNKFNGQEDESSKVWVAAHRGDWRGYADNSIEGIESCIRMGIDFVEIDVALTKDSVLILMHDKTVDRTTSGKGLVSDLTLQEIKALNLKNGLGRASGFTVPTFKEAMLTTKGKILVNVDKADNYFDLVYKVLEETGTLEEAVIKSDKNYESLRDSFGDLMDKMIFMPVVHLNDETNIEEIVNLLERKYPFYELVFEKEHKELLYLIQSTLKGTSSKIWINSLWPSLCAGYSDDTALSDPDGTWGYLIHELGATVIQTDRPEMLKNYLQEKGLHK